MPYTYRFWYCLVSVWMASPYSSREDSDTLYRASRHMLSKSAGAHQSTVTVHPKATKGTVRPSAHIPFRSPKVTFRFKNVVDEEAITGAAVARPSVRACAHSTTVAASADPRTQTAYVWCCQGRHR